MIYADLDLHKRFSVITATNTQGQELVKQQKLPNNGEIIELFKGLGEQVEVAIEATRSWYWLYDLLEEILDDVALAHPLKVRAIAEARIKIDKISADILTDLLRSNLLPEVYVSCKETRETKNVLRQWMFFVRVQTMVKNRIHAILDRHPEILSQAPEVSDLFGASGMEWLKQIVLPGQDNRLLASELKLLEVLKRKISESNGIVKELGCFTAGL
jgi:transposase